MFGKKKKTALAAAEAERAAQASSIELLERRLEAAEHAKAVLETRLVEVDTSNRELSARLTALDSGVGSMSEHLVRLTSASTEVRDRLSALDERIATSDVRVDAISYRLGEVEGRTGDLDELTARLHGFAERLDQQAASPPPPAPTPPPPPPPVPAADVPAPPSAADEARLTELRDRLDALVDEVATVDGRVTSISTELANQLTELSSDIAALDERASMQQSADAAPVDPAAIDALVGERVDAALDGVLGSTERLAAEQARYEIQFRADLAELAERIRRPGTT